MPAGEQNIYMYYGNPTAPNGTVATDFTTAASGLGAQTVGSEVQGPGPVAYWAFDEGTGTTTSDRSSSGLTATLSSMSSPPTATSGWQTEETCISSKCLAFDGSNDSVTVADNSLLEPQLL
jgi:hypothetical protein